MEERFWSCKVGPAPSEVPQGGDGPMRQAVKAAFEEMFGTEAAVNFSGWGAALTESERVELAGVEARAAESQDETPPVDETPPEVEDHSSQHLDKLVQGLKELFPDEHLETSDLDAVEFALGRLAAHVVQIAESEGWIKVAVEANKAVDAYLRAEFPGLEEHYGMPVDGVRCVVQHVLTRDSHSSTLEIVKLTLGLKISADRKVAQIKALLG